MYFVWFKCTPVRVLKFVEIKEGGFNFCGEAIFQNVWIIWFPLLYFNLKSSMDPNYSSIIRFHSIMHELGKVLWEFSNLYKLKMGDIISRGDEFCRMSDLFGPPLLYFNFKSFLDPNSAPFISFRCICYDSGVLLSGFSNFYKFKTGDLLSGWNQFCRMSGLFGAPSVFKS